MKLENKYFIVLQMRSKKTVEERADEAFPTKNNKELWVEKYSPRYYTQLLSKEVRY